MIYLHVSFEVRACTIHQVSKSYFYRKSEIEDDSSLSFQPFQIRLNCDVRPLIDSPALTRNE
jgi:hypothetical protein